jgi:streptogrisin C
VAREAPAPPLSQIRQSVDLIRGRFHVSQAEAMRRLELQRDASALAGQLTKQLPGVYTGMSIDQQHGGILVISGTDPALVTSAVRNFSQRAYVRVQTVAYSQRQLDQTASLLQKPYDLRSVVVWANPDNDHVVVSAGPGIQRQVRSAAARLGVNPAMVQYQPYPKATDTACTIVSCDPPMRGGTQLQMYTGAADTAKSPVDLSNQPAQWFIDSSGQKALRFCTAGFNVRGSDGFAYVLTAGHCKLPRDLSAKSPYPAYTASETDQWVGVMPGSWASNVFPTDGALLPYIDGAHAGYWLPNGQGHNLVYAAQCGTTQTGSSCPNSTSFPITKVYTVSQISPGWAVCTTGAGTQHTSCGFIQGHYQGGLASQVCIKMGDSGGPWFSQVDHAAYGISTATISSCGQSGYLAEISPVSSILSAAQAATGITYHIITTPAG